MKFANLFGFKGLKFVFAVEGAKDLGRRQRTTIEMGWVGDKLGR